MRILIFVTLLIRTASVDFFRVRFCDQIRRNIIGSTISVNVREQCEVGVLD